MLEFLVAMSIHLILLGLLIGLYQQYIGHMKKMFESRYVQQVGNIALMILGQEIQMSGFAPLGTQRASPFIFGCSQGLVVDHQLGKCQPSSEGSDTLSIKYFASSENRWVTQQRQVIDCLGNGAGIEQGEINLQYFIRYSALSKGNELYCRSVGKKNSVQPILERVNALYFRYWLKGEKAPLPAHQIISSQWKEIVAVDICVFVKTENQASTLEMLDCWGAKKKIVDGAGRQVFFRSVRLRNQ